MGDPLPNDPDETPDPAASPPPIRRADWLVGAEEGLRAEQDATGHDPEAPFEAPRLSLPQDPDAGQPRPSARFRNPFPGQVRPPSPAAPPPPPAPPSPSLPTWDAGASSIPVLRRSAPEGGPAIPAIPELARDFPMDDAEERARISARAAEQEAVEAAIAARPHAVVKPQEFEIPVARLPAGTLVGHALRNDRRVQLVALAVVLGIVLYAVWPREEKTISVAHLIEQPTRYADTEVRVGGHVSEVFPVGGSWAFTLVQGRDTIVVFSRTRRPRPREHVVVVGTLSSGYLDGQMRAAIFEATH